MPTVTVERTYLELTDRPKQTTAESPPPGVTITEEAPCPPHTYRALYREVGRDYHWLDRLAWSDDELARYLTRGDVRVWVLRDEAGVGGYFELVRHPDESVEIAYFGLLRSRHGRGLGRLLLARAIREGWDWGANRVWLHTCTLDSPTALPNYLARGFVPFKRETYQQELPGA